jgi:hypothetical protein
MSGVETPAEQAPVERAEYLDYRGFLALSDVAAVGLFIAAAGTKNGAAEALGFGGASVYALGAPAIHLANQQPGRSAISLGLRLGAPLALGTLGFAVGAASCQKPSSSSYDGYDGYPEPASDEPSCAPDEAVWGGIGVVSGMLVAMLVDDIVLGKVKEKPARATTGGNGQLLGASPHFQLGLAPFIAPHADGGGVLAVGAF